MLAKQRKKKKLFLKRLRDFFYVSLSLFSPLEEQEFRENEEIMLKTDFFSNLKSDPKGRKLTLLDFRLP